DDGRGRGRGGPGHHRRHLPPAPQHRRGRSECDEGVGLSAVSPPASGYPPSVKAASPSLTADGWSEATMNGPLAPVWLVLLFPLIGVLLNGFLGPRLGKGFVKWVGPLVILAAFAVSAWTFQQ